MDAAGDRSQIDLLCELVSQLRLSVEEVQRGYAQIQGQLASSATSGNPAPPPVQIPVPVPVPVPAEAVPSTAREPKLPLPDRFSGERGKFRLFKSACHLYFSLQPRTFSNEKIKVGVVISLLQGEPQAWALRLVEQDHPVLFDTSTFFEAMAELYDDPGRAASAESALQTLRQGKNPVEDYVTEFRRWASDTAWNDAALRFQFRQGLSDQLKDELARVGVPDTLKDLVHLSIQIDRRLRERRLERTGSARPSWFPTVPATAPLPPAAASGLDDPEPMQLGLARASLSPEERQRRRTANLCLYCGASGHFRLNCPVRPSGEQKVPVASDHFLLLPTPSHVSVSLLLQGPQGENVRIEAILDSGACSCFFDAHLAQQLQLPIRKKARPLSIQLADGSSIHSGPIILETAPLLVTLQGDHQELLTFDLIPSPLFPAILGMPWLKTHNPRINWHTKEISFDSTYCKHFCFPRQPLLLGACSEKIQLIPSVYHEFLDVFDKKGADKLPPRRIYDCPIDLQQGATIPY